MDFVVEPPTKATSTSSNSTSRAADESSGSDEGLGPGKGVEKGAEEEGGGSDSNLPPRTTFFTDAEFDEYCSQDDEKPLLIALHGLSGGSHEEYLRCVLAPLVDAGWDALVVNSRG